MIALTGPVVWFVASVSSASPLHWVDLDGDGRFEVLAIDAGSLRAGRARADGTLVDATAELGLPPIHDARFLSWHDVDGDGADELFVGTDGPSQLLRFESGSFVERTASSGLVTSPGAREARWIDYDGDGRTDLHLAHDGGHEIFHALEDGMFERVALDWLTGTSSARASEGPALAVAPIADATDAAGRVRTVPREVSGASSDAANAGGGSARGDRTSPQRPARVVVGPGGVASSATAAPPATNLLDCVQSLKDQSGGACVKASSVPALGHLYPLGPELFIDGASGHVGVGTLTPSYALEVAGQIVSGTGNDAPGLDSAIGGGLGNTATATRATVAGGEGNRALAEGAFVGGGLTNLALSERAAIAGGVGNRAGYRSAVGGGDSNAALGNLSTVAGGKLNEALQPGAFVGGGEENVADGLHATVAGGERNEASGATATIGGGVDQVASGTESTVAGGALNDALGFYATIGGGRENRAFGTGTTVGGGFRNAAGPDESPGASVWEAVGATIAGGESNVTRGDWSAIGGGFLNTIGEPGLSPIHPGHYATIAGGVGNYASADYSFIGGGEGNSTAEIGGEPAPYSLVVGGQSNQVVHDWGAIVGGLGNEVRGGLDKRYGFIGGGSGNVVACEAGTIAGGLQNSVGPAGSACFVGGGNDNVATGQSASVVGGSMNLAEGDQSFIGGGSQNLVSAQAPRSCIPAGTGNVVIAPDSWAAGRAARAFHPSTFVWADSTAGTFTSSGADQFLVRAAGGVGINTQTPLATFQVDGSAGSDVFRARVDGATRIVLDGNGGVVVGANTTPAFDLHVSGSGAFGGTAGKPGGGSWSVSSDRRLKKNVAELEDALATLLSLRGVTYEYRDPEAIDELGGTRTGFIAQEVEDVIPDWVSEGPDGMKRLTVRGFEALAVEALREVADENARLTERVHALEGRLARLEGSQATSAEPR